MSRSPSERGRRKPARIWWGSLPLWASLITFAASCMVLVLTGMLLVQQASTEIVVTKRTASIWGAVGMYRFIQGQLRSPERPGTVIYEQLSCLMELAGAQATQYLVIIEGPAPVLSSLSGIGPESVPVELRQWVMAGEGMYITAASMTMANEGEGKSGPIAGITLVTAAGERFPVYHIFPMMSKVVTLRDTQHAVYTVGAVLLLRLTVIVYLAIPQVAKPVYKAGWAALHLAPGQLDERMPVGRTGDLASLAVSMNEMASDLQQRTRELETPSAVQRRFVSDVSHELRIPMATIRMASDLLYKERDELSSGVGRVVGLMNAEIDRSSCTPADLSEISRFDAGAATLKLDEADMDVLVASEVRVQETFTRSQGSELRLHLDGTASAQLDARCIRHIIRSLLANAIDHEEGRPIDITTASDEEAVAVTVRNHGIGSGTELSGRVFDQFWRVDPSRARTAGGTEPGLTISLEDARLHRGWLSARGRPDKGVQFHLALPRGPEVTLNSSLLLITLVNLDSRRDLRQAPEVS